MRCLRFTKNRVAIAFNRTETETILDDNHGPDILIPGKTEWRVELFLETSQTIASITRPKLRGPIACVCGIHEEWLSRALRPGNLQAVQFDEGRYSIRLGFNVTAADMIALMDEPVEIIPAELTVI